MSMNGKLLKSVLLVLLMCCAAQVSYAQTADDKKIFRAVEQLPQFPDGDGELLKWIAEHINYPAQAIEEGVQGKVIIQFVVNKDGSIGQVVVARGRHPALDKEAVRVVKSLPEFIPGMMYGQPVNTWYTIPVNFQLPK